MKFSANLGFLWSGLDLPNAIRAAKHSGFDAVECHWPYETDPKELNAALSDSEFEMLGINTSKGPKGYFGLAAVVDQKEKARASIDQALSYAELVDAKAIHVMAGVAAGKKAKDCFYDNLAYACEQTKRTILIEPLNAKDAPGYFLSETSKALGIIKDLNCENLKLMFDCYHVGHTEGDIIGCLEEMFSHVGHIQFAGLPDRGSPDNSDFSLDPVMEKISALNWVAPIGAEYRPDGPTEASLKWLDHWKKL